ncbi:MAG: hypothetical protein EYC68_03850 [Chloroflexota bacterium]|nr:MAG: hypothetical protein EYC68_03850 [Chloroflexota bacterium]
MKTHALQLLIGNALTDADFCRALLNGSRRRILQTFPLTTQEIEILMEIRADSLDQFASEIHKHFLADIDEPAPLPSVRRHLTRMTHPHPYRSG